MCRNLVKSLISAANTMPQDIPIDGTINFGSVTHIRGRDLRMTGGNVIATGPGYYQGDATLTFIGSAGVTSITMYENGMKIPGKVATLTTEAGSTYTVVIPFMFRNQCCQDKTITAEISGAGITGASASIEVYEIVEG